MPGEDSVSDVDSAPWPLEASGIFPHRPREVSLGLGGFGVGGLNVGVSNRVFGLLSSLILARSPPYGKILVISEASIVDVSLSSLAQAKPRLVRVLGQSAQKIATAFVACSSWQNTTTNP